MKKVLFVVLAGIAVVVVIVTVVLISAYLASKKTSTKTKAPAQSGFVVPKKVTLDTGTRLTNDKRELVLLLSAVASNNGCTQASDLKITHRYADKQLTVEILGYNTETIAADVCASVIIESRAKVAIETDWLKNAKDYEIVIKLAGVENHYKINYQDYRATLQAFGTTNVIIPDLSSPESPSAVPLQTTLFPADVAMLSLSGSGIVGQDFRSDLKNFAKSKNLTPIEEIYPEIVAGTMNQIYVVIKNRPLPEKNTSESLGELPNHPGIQVNLQRIFDDADYF